MPALAAPGHQHQPHDGAAASLFAAVRARDVGATERAVLEGAEPSVIDPHTGHTPLSLAFELCKTDVR